MLLRRKFHFEASHFIPDHPACGTCHGHSYEVEAVVEGPLQKNGMVIDFHELRDALGHFINEFLDHRHLNDVVPMAPTAEMLALLFFDRLERYLRDRNSVVRTYSVTVWETRNNAATCTRADWERNRQMLLWTR